MAITESSRKDMYDSLERLHGREVATTIMEHLPPLGWADVARQSDIGTLRTDLDRLGHRLDNLDSRLIDAGRDLRTWALSMMSLNAALTAAAIALTKL